MVNVPDSVTLGELCTKAAEALVKAGLERRIDIFREVEIDDPAVRIMLGRGHRLRVRVRITATSLLFEAQPGPQDDGAAGGDTKSGAGADGPESGPATR